MQPVTQQPGGRVIAIGPVADESVAAPAPLNVVAIAYEPADDPFHSWVAETGVQLVEQLRDLLAAVAADYVTGSTFDLRESA